MKKSLFIVTAFAAIAEIIANNQNVVINTPSLHLPDSRFGTVEKNISIEFNDKNGKTYENFDGLWHETIYTIFSVHVCTDGDCFDGIELSRSETKSCNIYGDCSAANIYDFWATKGEDDAWINIEFGF